MRWNEAGQPDHLTFAGLRGGGKGGSTQQTSNTAATAATQIPAWLDTAAQQAVGSAQNLAAAPYVPYTGQMVAGTPQATQQAYQQIAAMQGAANPAYQASQNAYQGLLGSAAPVTADQINQFSNQLYGGYNQNVVQPMQGLLSNYLQGAGPATAGQVGSNAMQLMSPYEQAVINPALQAGQQQLDLANQQIAGQAANVGAFGGSRMGVQQGVAEAQTALGTGQAIGNLLNQGWQAALPQAGTLAANQSQQGYNAASLLGQLGQSGYNAAQTQAGTIGANNLQAGLTAAQQGSALATQQQQQAAAEAALMQSVGTAQQSQYQNILNAQMGQFYNQQQYPYMQLDTLLSAIGGTPYGTTSQTTGTGTQTQQTNPGLLNTITGLVGTGAKIAGMF